MSENRIALIAGCFLILILSALIFYIRTSAQTEIAVQIHKGGLLKSGSREKIISNRDFSPATVDEVSNKDASSLDPNATSEMIFEEIEDASVTYNASALPRIERYLTHPDPEIREAAINGMIVLGDASAGPILRKAAKQALSPQESVAFLEAADYVELPSGIFSLRRNRSGLPQSRKEIKEGAGREQEVQSEMAE